MDGQLQLWDNLPQTESGRLTFNAIRTPVWTENKAKLIAKYLFYFVLITKHGVYIDGFAAPQDPELKDGWAAKLVLESEPKFLRQFWLCEKNLNRVRFLHELRDSQPQTRPKRTIEVVAGDFNVEVQNILAAGSIKDSTAAFCLLDQRTFECEWGTVQVLASHKKTNKIELFYFLGTGWLDRAIAGLSVNELIAEKWWGKAGWRELQGMNGTTRAQLFCDRFKSELGYKYAHAWPIFDRGHRGNIMYHMIHATDHADAPKIMARAYRKATSAPEPIEQLELELSELRKTEGSVEIE